MKRIWIVVAFLLVYLFFLFMNTTWAVDRWLPVIFKKQFDEVVLQSYSIENQSYKFPQTVKLNNVALEIVYKDKLYKARAPEITLYDVFQSFFFTHQMKFDVKRLEVEWDGGSIKGMEPKLVLGYEDFVFQKINGILSANELTIGPYVFNNLYARMNGKKGQLQVFEISSDCYEGELQGQIMVSTDPYLNYIIWFKSDKMKAAALSAVHPEIFSHLDGDVNGAFRIGGDLFRLNILVLNLEAVKGAKIDGELLRYIQNFVNDDEAQEIEAKLQTHEVIIPDAAFLQLRNAQANQLNVLFGINSQEDDFYFQKLMKASYADLVTNTIAAGPDS